MIKNERQYRISKARLREFRDSINAMGRDKTPGLHPLLAKAQKDSLESQMSDLAGQIREYEELKSGKIPIPGLLALDDLPRALIRARIALGLSQKDLGKLVGLPEQQIQRYEARDYESASVGRMIEIVRALNSAREGRAQVKGRGLRKPA